MAVLPVELVDLEERTLYGLWKNSNDRTVSGDIDELSKSYYKLVSLSEGSVLPYAVLSRNYDEKSGDFELMAGGTLEKDGLEKLTLPAGEYAKIEVGPKLGFLWGQAIGEAKRYFYAQWLPHSRYRGLNLEYEYHTEKAAGKHPRIDLIFAVERK